MLVAGLGVIVAEFFDVGQSHTLPWTQRPQASVQGIKACGSP